MGSVMRFIFSPFGWVSESWPGRAACSGTSH